MSTPNRMQNTVMIVERILTLKEASEMLGLAERTVKEKVASGEIVGYKPSKQIYLLFSDLLAYVKSGT